MRMRKEIIGFQGKGRPGNCGTTDQSPKTGDVHQAPDNTSRKVLAANIEKIRSRLFEHSVQSAMRNLAAIQRAQEKIKSLNGKCRGCSTFASDLAHRTIAEAELRLSRSNGRAVRVAKRRFSAGFAN
jgi:hypothetical protein